MSGVLLHPRKMEKNESVEQYLGYFQLLKDVNDWDEEQAVKIYRALLPPGSDQHGIVANLTAAEQASFTAVKKAILASRQLLRDTLVTQLFSLKRKPKQPLEELANKVVLLVEEVYSSFAKAN